MIRASACSRSSISKARRLLPVFLIAAVTYAQEVLTNDAVIRMVKAKLGDAVIVEKIRSSPGKYSLTVDSLIELSRQGVPEKVILAMQAKQPGGQVSANAPADAETVEVAEAFWRKILPRCGDSFYYAGSELELHIHGSRGAAARANNGLTEYEGVTFPRPNTLPISIADEANGVHRKAVTFMFPAKWRERTPGQNTWQDWASPSADSFSALKLIGSAPGHFGFTGVMAIELWKVKDQWFYLIPPEMDPLHQLIPVSEVTEQKVSCDAALRNASLPLVPGKAPAAGDSVRCRDTLNQPVPVQEVARENAIRWCGITPQRWDQLTAGARNPASLAAPRQSSALGETPSRDGFTWTNGDPTFKDGITAVRLTHSLIVVEQGSGRAEFYLPAKGSNAQGVQGLRLVPPSATSTETYNTRNHKYFNSNPNSDDKSGDYPDGPPPGMIARLGPFVQLAMKVINQAKQTVGGASWDDQYFRNMLRPYGTMLRSNPK